jgi:multidrug efflux pump subunit AcrA (membrane-fusion protein)
MASGQTQVSAETIEKTKQQIRGLVSEIAQLSKSDMGPEEFYSAFLQRVVQALAAVGGAIWVLGEGRKTQLSYQINISEKLLDRETEDADKHFKLLDYVVQANQGQLIPPLSGFQDERMGANPTRQLLVIHPMGHDNQVEGLLEIFQRADTQPATQRGYLQFVKQMCELASEWFKNRKLRDLGDRSSLWAQADQFSRQVHESLDVRETCYTIVNEGRRLLGCDRVTVAILRQGSCQVEAVSGQDTIDNRSNVVTLLGKLATRVVKSGEPLWYGGSTEDLPPQIEEAIEDYVDQSYTKSLAVIPLREPKQIENSAPGTGGQVAVEELAHTGKIIGALVIEQIESDIPRDILAPRLDLVYEHSARALSNAIDHNSLFLMPVWRAIGKSRFVVEARTLPKTVLITSSILILLLAGLIVPGNFDMNAKGTLQPTKKQDIFAPGPGEVLEVNVDNGTHVKKGEVVIRMRNPDLEIKKREIEGQYNAAQEQLFAVVSELTNPKPGTSAQDRVRLESDEAKLRPQVEFARKQLDLINERLEKLSVKSPIDGQVITWDVKKQLQNRPVETGQSLLTIAAAGTDYELELFMPERRIGHLHRARDAVKAKDPNSDLKADFISMTDPGVSHSGRVIQVNPTAEPHEEHGNMVRIRVQPDNELIGPRPGATVTAKVHCGRAPWLWAKLHEAWEWLEAAWFGL